MLLPPSSKQAKKIAVNMLYLRSYSVNEVRYKLTRRGCTSETVDEVVAWLLEKRYLNDADLCSNLFETYCKSKKYSLRMIISKLKQRGIDDDIISEVVQNYDLNSEVTVALKLVERRFRECDISDNKLKISRYLAGRGFSANTISKIMSSLELNTPG